jgi:hypothetical protein
MNSPIFESLEKEFILINYFIMRKTLLFGAAFAFASVAANAQYSNTDIGMASEANKVPLSRVITEPTAESTQDFSSLLRRVGSKQQSGAITKIVMGTSYNPYTHLRPETNPLLVDESFGMIGLAHRQDATRSGSSGDVQYTWTLDNGATFGEFRVTTEGSTYRFPNAGFFNPTNGTDFNEAIIHIAGPVVDQDQDAPFTWPSSFYITSKMDSSSIVEENILHEDLVIESNEANKVLYSNGSMFGGVGTSDGKFRLLSSIYDYTDGTSLFYNGGTMVVGTYVDSIKSFNHTLVDIWADILPANLAYGEFSHAWSKDGQIGYVIAMSQDTTNTDEVFSQPHIAKTIDGGATWNEVAFTAVNSTNLPGLENYIPTLADASYSLVHFQNDEVFDAQVDNNGQLHITASVKEALNLDPGEYNTANTHLIHFFTKEAGGLDFRYIWKYNTLPVPYTANGEGTWENGANVLGWDHRTQSSKTTDESKIFVHFTDTQASLGNTTNAYPDLFAWGIDANTGFTTSPTNFTLDTDWDASGNTFSMMSTTTISDAGVYSIPVVTTYNETEDPLKPVNHELVQGIEFTDADFQNRINIAELTDKGFDVNIYPNPVNGATAKLNISLVNASDVTVTVANTLGQTVQVLNPGVLSGNNSLTVNVSELEAGIYFYSVKANNTTVTKRLIVR